MKAVVCSSLKGIEDLALAEIEAPLLKPGTVRIQVKAASVNFPDILMAKGLYQVQPPLPFVLGVEGAGDIIDVADDVSDLAIGQRVMTYAGQGCFAEQAVVPAQRVYRIPDAMDYATASGFSLAFGTTYHALVDCGGLADQQTVLILGASGGLGLCAVQLAKAMGARVIAAASTEEKRAVCADMGSDFTIDSDAGRLREQVRAITNGRGVDIVFDVVGGSLTDPALRCIVPYGRYVIVGYAAGIPNIKANLVLLKQARVVGVSYRQFVESRPDDARSNMEKILQIWRSGRLRSAVPSQFLHADFKSALKLMEDRRVIGKAIIRIAQN